MAIVYTQADLDVLKEALLTGASVVRIDGREVRYRTQAELLQLIKAVQEQVDAASSSQSSSMVQATFTKGKS
jgi:hypothetical protein